VDRRHWFDGERTLPMGTSFSSNRVGVAATSPSKPSCSYRSMEQSSWKYEFMVSSRARLVATKVADIVTSEAYRSMYPRSSRRRSLGSDARWHTKRVNLT
jgi:hypothetical protein